MTTDFSAQADDASNPPQEPVNETRPSAQAASQPVPNRSEQPSTPSDSVSDDIAGSGVSAPPPAQNQQPPSPQDPGRYAEDPSGRGDSPSGRGESPSAAPQRPVAAAQTSEQEAPPAAPDPGAGAGDGADGAKHSVIGDPSGYATRWESIQVGFVDDPRSAVQEAETLVSDVMTEVARIFQQQQQRLEVQWSGGDRASTDDLRVAFQRYRDFFQRLLQV